MIVLAIATLLALDAWRSAGTPAPRGEAPRAREPAPPRDAAAPPLDIPPPPHVAAPETAVPPSPLRETSEPAPAAGQAPPAPEPAAALAWARLPPFEDDVEPLHEPPPRELRDARRFGDYVIRAWESTGIDDEEGKWSWHPAFDILHRGRSVYAESGYPWYEIGRCCSQEIPIGSDLTGDGVPDLVMTRRDGGNRSPALVCIFELGPELRLVAGHAFYHDARLEDLDGDGVPEIETADDSLAPWPDWYPGSPAARVVLRFRDGAYVPAPELMRKDRSAFPGWRERALAVRDDPLWSEAREWSRGPADLWRYACDLVYAGQGDLAGEYLQLAWPRHVEGWEEFRAELRRKLEASPYWPAVRSLNGWGP